MIFEIVSSFASPSLNRVTGQNYRKIDLPLEVWNRLSSDKTEGVAIVSERISSGTIRCGVSCQNNRECGGFLYDKTSGSCTMKSVNLVKILFPCIKFYIQQFLCLLMPTPSRDQDSVAVFVKTERFAPCLGM